MSVFAVVGLPGSGKTYSVVEHHIFPALRQHRCVVTNVPLKWDLVRAQFPGCDLRQVNVETWVTEPDRIEGDCPAGSVIVLDEVWRLWPAGARADKIPEAFRSFLAEHRHRMNQAGDSQQIVLVTQDLKQISAFARQQVEQTFRCVKLSFVGASKRFRVDVFQGPAEGPNPPVSLRLRQMLGRYDKRVFGFYVSHTMSEAGDGVSVNESAMDDRGNVLKRPLLMLTPVIIVLLVAGGLYGLRRGGLGGGNVARASDVGAVGRLASPLVAGRGGGGGSGVARWHVTARYAGLCTAGSCGWAVLEDGSQQLWVPLNRCRQLALEWLCAVPGGGEASDAFVRRLEPSLAPRSSLMGRLER